MYDSVLARVSELLGGVLRFSQVKTLAALVTGLIIADKAVSALIGRAIPGSATGKSKVRRAWRFGGNSRVDWGAVGKALLVHLTQEVTDVVIALDWTDMGKWKVLTSAVVTPHRGIPVLWTVIDSSVRMADAELAHVKQLQSLMPAGKRICLLADRGFDSAAFIAFLIKQGIVFCIRCSGSITVRKLNESRFKKIDCRVLTMDTIEDFGEVWFSAMNPVLVRVIRTHESGQEEPWILVTNIDGSAELIVKHYAHRFSIEHAFRDFKGGGWALGRTRMRSVETLSRFLLVPVIANVILVGIGQYGEVNGWQYQFQANTIKDRRVLSLRRLGRDILTTPSLSLKRFRLTEHLKRLPATMEDIKQRTWRPRPRVVSPNKPRLSAASLKVVMAKFEITTHQLATTLRMDPQTIRQALNGSLKVPPAWIPKLCEIASITEAELWATVSPPPPEPRGEMVRAATLQAYLQRFNLKAADLAKEMDLRTHYVIRVVRGQLRMPTSWFNALCRPDRISKAEFLTLGLRASQPASQA